jgi:hypothetical protein
MKILYKYTPWFVVLIYLILFSVLRSPEREWDRIINSDGKGYYAYLPAIFIYHDLQFKFTETYEYQYYPANKSVFKEYRQKSGDQVVNKYFPGLAIIWLPFFLFGHLMAWLEIFPRDGYSLPYQYAILLSAFWFLFLGAKWLMKLLLANGASEKQASLVTLLIAFGTNLIFYVIIEPTMTHVYSFALVTGFLYASTRFYREPERKWFMRGLLALLLLMLIRPTNGMLILVLPFVAGSFSGLKAGFRNLVNNRSMWLRGAIMALLLMSVPMVLWYIQTGHPFVYTYGEEKLNLFSPNFLQILFSTNRGWFVYTPIAVVALGGFVVLFQTDRFRFYSLLIFLAVFIYVVSCWWVWYYASKFGQRVFIDIYAMTGLLLLFMFIRIKGTIWSKILTVTASLLILLNLVQFWQHSQWIFPPYNISSEIYRDAFFTFTRKARVYVPDEAIAKVSNIQNDMETEKAPLWMNQKTRTKLEASSGNWSSLADRKLPYSVGPEITPDSLFTTKNRIIRVQAMVLSPRERPEATLVVDFQNDEKSLSYNQVLLEKFVPANEWTLVEAAVYFPVNFPNQGRVKVYFYNPSSIYDLFIDDLSVDFISLKEQPQYLKLEGILLPEQIK